MRDFHQHTSDHMDMSKLYSRETDRSAALLSTSFLDTVLEEVLKSFFVDDKNTDKLFQGYAPLSSFSAKIDIMYALGLINKDMLTDISTVRKIRNHFAHSWQDISFDKSPISALCTNFLTTRTLFFTKSGVYGVILNPKAKIGQPNVYAGNDPSIFSNKEQFLMVVTILITCMLAIAQTEKQRVSTDFDYLAVEL